jgi:hypothetical protein
MCKKEVGHLMSSFYITEENHNKVLIQLIADVRSDNWSGAKKRSCQIFEIFERNDFKLIKLENTSSLSKLKTIGLGLYSWLRFGLYKPICVESVRSAGHQIYRYQTLLKKFHGIKAVVIEGTGFGALGVVPYLKSKGLKVILVPANLESLAPYDKAWTHKKSIGSRLKEELRWLRWADHVFTISIEENWLLQVFGVESSFLPYFPPRSVLEKLQRWKKERKPDKAFGYLYMADFGNEPNIKALKALLENIKSGKVIFDAPLNIAGRCLMQVPDVLQEVPGIRFLGELSESKLEECYLKATGVVLMHYPSSGMLTRTVEALIMQIPIIGNIAAYKSYYHLRNIQAGFDYLLRPEEEERQLISIIR